MQFSKGKKPDTKDYIHLVYFHSHDILEETTIKNGKDQKFLGIGSRVDCLSTGEFLG